jgi:hypothetical protein
MALPRCDTWPHAVKTPIRLGLADGQPVEDERADPVGDGC